MIDNRIRIFHIHADFKFINFVNQVFNNEIFLNTCIIIGEKDKLEKEHHEKAFFFLPQKKYIKNIVDLVKEGDLVILYSLTGFHSHIALALPPNIKIAWRFFGFELYSRNTYNVYSDKTLKLINLNPKVLVNKVIRFLTKENDRFLKVLHRIDLFFGVFEEEYDLLKKKWPMLPKFLEWGIIDTKVDLNNTKQLYCILGNNRNAFNNHIDVIDFLKNSNNKSGYKTKILFNYGVAGYYAKKIMNSVAACKDIELINDFLSMREFENLYNGASALIINGYRQMALGNIWTALGKGVKVYLNEKNITMHWLLKNGLKIYSIDDFYNDYEKGNLALSEKEALHNVSCLNKIAENQSVENFQKKLVQIIKN